MLSDLKVFSEFLYTAATEVLQQQINLFNEASNGCLVLKTVDHVGDFVDTVHFAKVSGGLVRRRNAYGTGSVSTKHMSHLDETMVKVAAGTPPIELDPGQWDWIQRSPEEAAAAMSQQLSVDMLADMVNTAVGVIAVCLSGQATVTNDISAKTGSTSDPTPYPNNRISPLVLNDTAALFGDQAARIRLWLMHSSPMHQLFGNALQNTNRLFQYGNINVSEDGFGRRYIMADVPALVTAGTAPQFFYTTLGLTPEAVSVHQQDDFRDNFDERNGQENLSLTYQAQWSYEVGVRGFAWDKTNGGKSPNDATLMTGSNWDRVVTDDKNLPGVVLKTARNVIAA